MSFLSRGFSRWGKSEAQSGNTTAALQKEIYDMRAYYLAILGERLEELRRGAGASAAPRPAAPQPARSDLSPSVDDIFGDMPLTDDATE